MNEEEEFAGLEHTHGEAMTRREGKNDPDQPPAVRARVEVVPQPKWTSNSRVREVLLDGLNLLETPKLNDFLRNNVGGRGVVDSNENVTMEAFVVKPDMYIQDKEMIRFITALPAYERIRENMGILREKVRVLNEVAYNLEKAGVYSLQQWDEFTDKESILLMARGILNAALN
ncbi:putative retrotransposon hot spot protein (RHS), partial [Trypanosoma theileri]